MIRRSTSGSGYELELQSRKGLSPRGLPLWLKVGSIELRVARESPTLGEYGAVFQLSQVDFDSLVDGAPVNIITSTDGTGRCLGTLDKSGLSIR